MGEEDISSKDYYIEPISEGYKTGIFWDVKASPFPQGMDPDEIYQRVQSDLSERGASPKMSIVAYVDDKEAYWDEFLRKKKTWKSSICFVPLGPNLSLRMLHDTLLWKEMNPAPANVFFVSEKKRRSPLLNRWLGGMVGNWPYSLYLVEPTGSVEEWPGSLFENSSSVKIQGKEVNPAEPRPAKRREVEEGSGD